LKDKEKFIRNWEKQRRKGKLKYVLINAGLVAAPLLGGIVFGSVFLYSSPSSYSFVYYLPTYFFTAAAGLLVGTLKSLYVWGKNEAKYSKLSHE
jgi:hypothetical protein